MSALATSSPLTAAFKSLGALFLFILFGLFLDSSHMVDYSKNGQEISNICMLLVFGFTLYQVSRKNRELMMYAVLIAFAGEYLFSIALGMYTYRLENVPHYIPPGHALVYIGVLYFSKAAAIRKNVKRIEKFFTIAIVLYAVYFLIFKGDVFGFSLTILTLYFLRTRPKERLFYLTMYIAVAYLEIIGTHFLNWKWPATAFNIFSFLPSANPPSGISFFYFGLDLGCLWLYKQRHKIAWKRMKNIRKINLK